MNTTMATQHVQSQWPDRVRGIDAHLLEHEATGGVPHAVQSAKIWNIFSFRW